MLWKVHKAKLRSVLNAAYRSYIKFVLYYGSDTIEKLLGRNSSGSGLENREYGRRDPLRWPRDTLYPQKLSLTSPTSGGRSVGIVRLLAKAMEFCGSESLITVTPVIVDKLEVMKN
jgi:hypothetical protein